MIRYRVERASETLEEARILLAEEHLNTAVNRIYYACFYVVSALLLTEGHSSARHSGLRALFDQHWVKKGRVSVELGRLYRTLFVNRQKADYADFVEYGIDEVAHWLAEAERFVQTLGELVEAKLNEILS